jgi:hypothetical protein
MKAFCHVADTVLAAKHSVRKIVSGSREHSLLGHSSPLLATSVSDSHISLSQLKIHKYLVRGNISLKTVSTNKNWFI